MGIFEKMEQRWQEQGYRPQHLTWATSYEDEERQMRQLICGNPSDVRLLKREYESLTGSRFKRKQGE